MALLDAFAIAKPASWKRCRQKSQLTIYKKNKAERDIPLLVPWQSAKLLSPRAAKRIPTRCALGRGSELNGQPISTELRNRVRYRLSADAVFAWEGPQHGRLLGEGVTRDISLRGVFIFTRMFPPVGTSLELDIFLSPNPGNGGRTVRIKTDATVIRVEHSTSAEGFAAVSQDFTLLFDGNTRNAFSVSAAHKGEEGIVSD